MAIPIVENYIQATAQVLEFPPDLIKIVISLILNFPLCGVLRFLPFKQLKAAYMLAVGLFYLCGIFSLYFGTIYCLAQCLFTYYLCKWAPLSSRTPFINLIASMCFLMCTHFKEQFSGGDYVNNIGISGTQMILVIKVTSYAFDVFDGTQKMVTENPHRKTYRIDSQPDLLSYLSFCFFFPSVLTGPSFQFRDFDEWLSRSRLVKFTKDNRLIRQSIPSSRVPTILKVLEGCFWTYVYFTANKYLSSTFLFTDRYRESPFSVRACYLWFLCVSYQFKYYIAWTFSEAACIQCGLGFNGPNPSKPGRYRWNKLQNVRPAQILMAQNAHGYINNWNMNTSKWLRFYVYERVVPAGKKPGTKAALITFVFSASWHGTRPGYYLTFIMGAAFQQFGRLYRRTLRPIFLGTPYKPLYDIVCFLGTQLAFGFAVQPFILLNLGPSLYVWGQVYYYVPVVLFLSYLVLVKPFGHHVRPQLKEVHKEM